MVKHDHHYKATSKVYSVQNKKVPSIKETSTPMSVTEATEGDIVFNTKDKFVHSSHVVKNTRLNIWY